MADPLVVEQALFALARHGDAEAARRELVETIPDAPTSRTLRNWKVQHAERYRTIVEQLAPEIERGVVEHYRQISLKAAEGQLKAIDQAVTDLENGKYKDASSVAKNLAVAGAVGVDKLMLMTDRPTQRTETLSAIEQLDKLASRIGQVIDSTAEPIEDVKELPA